MDTIKKTADGHGRQLPVISKYLIIVLEVVILTSEARKRYGREYREKNKERIKEQRMNRIREKALADLKSVNAETVDMCIIRTWQGGEYHFGRSRR